MFKIIASLGHGVLVRTEKRTNNYIYTASSSLLHPNSAKMARGRIPVVCSFCRRRKIKCDMGSPCSGCVKFSNSDCDYGISPQSSEHKVTKREHGMGEVDDLKERLRILEQAILKKDELPRAHPTLKVSPIPEAAPDGQISFHETIRSTECGKLGLRRHFGPFRWVVSVSLDPGLFRIFQQISKVTNKQCKKEINDTTVKFAAAGADVGVVVGHNSPEPDLRARIQSSMPSKRIVWMLIDRFFRVVYPFAPILDEEEFGGAMHRLLGPRSYEEEKIFVLTFNDRDFAHLGTLFIVLRLAYLTMFTSTGRLAKFCFHNSVAELSYLSQAKIPSEMIRTAQKCLGMYNLVEDAPVEVIQLVSLLQIYSMHSPERPNPECRNLTLSNILNLMAYYPLLHREACDVYSPQDANARKNLLARKLWYSMVFLDAASSALTGNFLTIHPYSFDVEVPVFDAANLNIQDLHLEEVVCNSFAKIDAVRKLLSEVFELTGRVSGTVSIHEVSLRTKALEDKHAELFIHFNPTGRFRPQNGMDAFTKVSLFQQFLFLHHVIVGICTHLFFYHQKRKEFDLAQYYQQKIAVVITTRLFPFIPLLLDDQNPFAGSTDLFVITPFFQCLQQATLFFWSLFIDYRARWYNMREAEDHLARVTADPRYEKTFTSLYEVSQSVFEMLTIIGTANAMTLERYPFNQKVNNVHTLIVDSVSAPCYFHGDESFRTATPSYLDDLNQVFQGCLNDDSFSTLRGVSDSEFGLSEVSTVSNLYLEPGKFTPDPLFDFMQFEDIFLGF